MPSPPPPHPGKRSHLPTLIGGLTLTAAVIALLIYGPITQPEAYHHFANTRTVLGIPNAADVLSNAAFVLVGGLGLWRTAATAVRLRSISTAGGLAPALAGTPRGLALPVTPIDLLCIAVFFTGVLLTGPGSAWYHLNPNNNTLLWDRLPMALAFAGLVAAIVSDRLRIRPITALATLTGLVALGILSVLWWHFGELASPGQGDLRLYIVVQYGALLAAMALAFTPGRLYGRGLLALACGLYILAKVLESTDAQVFNATGQFISGHTLKHIAAACGAGVIITALRPRR
jgi:hypothetical protein